MLKATSKASFVQPIISLSLDELPGVAAEKIALEDVSLKNVHGFIQQLTVNFCVEVGEPIVRVNYGVSP